MNKLFLIGTLLMSGFAAKASHNMSCDVEGRVGLTANLMRLNDSVTFSRQPSLVDNDHEQLISVDIISVSNQTGTSKCHWTAGSTVSVLADKKNLNVLKQGELVKLNYRNVGDRAASRITWTVLK